MKFIQEVSNLIIKHKAVSDCGRQEGKSFLFHNIALLDDGLEELASGFEPGEPVLETFQLETVVVDAPLQPGNQDSEECHCRGEECLQAVNSVPWVSAYCHDSLLTCQCGVDPWPAACGGRRPMCARDIVVQWPGWRRRRRSQRRDHPERSDRVYCFC